MISRTQYWTFLMLNLRMRRTGLHLDFDHLSGVGDDVCDFTGICLHFSLFYYFLIISFSDLVKTNNSGRTALIM